MTLVPFCSEGTKWWDEFIDIKHKILGFNFFFKFQVY